MMNNGHFCSNCEQCKHKPICNQTEQYTHLFNEIINIVNKTNVLVNTNIVCEHFESVDKIILTK